MPLKITRANDVIEVPALTVTVYSPPGFGKSTLGFACRKPIMLDFDRGAYRAANRKDSVQVEQWSDVANITADDLADYETVVIDTAGRALDSLAASIMASNPKMGNNGALSLQGFGQLKAQFTAFVKHIRTMGKDLVLLAHASEDKSGDDLIQRLDMQGASKNEVYKVSDAMAHLTIQNRERILDFRPTDASFGKDPGGLEAITVPDVSQKPEFMGDIIDRIKGKLNEITQEQREAMQAVQEWQEAISQAADVDSVNALLPDVKQIEDKALALKVKPILHKHAKELGLEYSKDDECYTPAQEKPEEAGPDEGDGENQGAGT